MSATEQVIEQIPEAVLADTAGVATVVKNNPYVLMGVALFAGSLGAFGGYKFAQKRLKMYYEDLANTEIAQAEEYYRSFRIKKTPEELAAEIDGDTPTRKAATKAFEQYAGLVPADTETPAETEEELMSDEERAIHEKNGDSPRVQEVKQTTRKHVFEGSRPTTEETFDPEAELLIRGQGLPYVITHDEFYENERDFEQSHLTYWQGDDVLVDERDQPIPDEDAAVGNDNLIRFGHGSKDENIVFVRNEQLEVDFEITRSFGKYSEEVLGFDTSDDEERGLKHSAGHGGIRKFRQSREE